MVDCNVDVSDRLGMTHIGVEGIISSIDAVKINVSVEQDICSESIQEVGTVGPDQEVILQMFDIDEVV